MYKVRKHPRERNKSAQANNLLVSYVSHNTMKPFGKAIAKDIIAASSPSFASSALMFRTVESCCRRSTARSSRSATTPVEKIC